jgi:hypothetical protein
MKKTFRSILAGALALLAVSCYDDSALRTEVGKLGDRVTAIEESLSSEIGRINSLFEKVQTLEDKVGAVKVETTDGVTKLTLTNGDEIVLSKNGAITIVDGGWATVATDGTVTPLGVKVGHELNFKVEGDELMVSYDGTTYDTAGDSVRALGNEITDLRGSLRDYIDAKAIDGLLYENNKLYLTYNGEIVSDPVEIVGGSGGGGGGGSSNNAVMTMTNTSGWIYKTIASGSVCPVSFEWSSLENEIATGPGVLKIIVNGVQKHTSAIQQGNHTLDISPWISSGDNTVKINISDIYGNSRTISVSITSVLLTITSTFDASIAYTGNIDFTYTPTGSAEKTVHFVVDDVEIVFLDIFNISRKQRIDIHQKVVVFSIIEVFIFNVGQNVLIYGIQIFK